SKVTPRDDQETPRDDADDAAASTALATRTVGESGAPVPPSHSPEGGEVEAERSEDAAVAEVVAATAASLSAGWLDNEAGKQKRCYSQKRDRVYTSRKNGSMVMLLALMQNSYERRYTNTGTASPRESDLLKKTTVSFRTAYTVAKERLSYKKLNPP
ncbi:hypothetical protein F7725_004275, partial [Dissostichus mawsoni]